MLIPLGSEEPASPGRAAAAWDELTRRGEEIARGWPSDKTSAEARPFEKALEEARHEKTTDRRCACHQRRRVEGATRRGGASPVRVVLRAVQAAEAGSIEGEPALVQATSEACAANHPESGVEVD